MVRRDRGLRPLPRRPPRRGAAQPLKLAAAARSDADAFVWIGLHEPTENDCDGVARMFGLHQLAVEDAVTRAPAAEAGRVRRLAVRGPAHPRRTSTTTSDVETGEITMFVGARHGGDRPARRGHGARRRCGSGWRSSPEVLAHGPAAVLYAVADAVVDHYLEVADELQTDLEELERSVFARRRTDDFAARSTSSSARCRSSAAPSCRWSTPMTQAGPTQDVSAVPVGRAAVLPRRAGPPAARERAGGGPRPAAAGILQAHIAQVGLRQNEDMRKISAWVAIVAVPTMIAGIYGMNFDAHARAALARTATRSRSG